MVKFAEDNEVKRTIKDVVNEKKEKEFTVCFCNKCRKNTAQEYLKDDDYEITTQCEQCGTTNEK